MNNLSWFLYAIDVLDALGGVVGFLSFMGSLAACACAFVYLIARNDNDNIAGAALSFLKITGFITVVSGALSVAVPSEKTLYLILGSEAGEAAVTSDTGKRVMDAVNKKLDEYLTETSVK